MNIVITARESNTLIEEIDGLAGDMFKSHPHDLLSKSAVLKRLVGDAGIDPQDREGLRKFLSDLRERIKGSGSMQMTVSFTPGQEFIEKLIDWVKKNLKEDVIVDIKTDPDIVGGLVLVYKGIYKDLSLGSALDKYFGEYHHASELPR